MINLYIGLNGSGKTSELNKIKDSLKDKFCLFFPCSSEIVSTIKNGKTEVNQGNTFKYENNLVKIIEKIESDLLHYQNRVEQNLDLTSEKSKENLEIKSLSSINKHIKSEFINSILKIDNIDKIKDTFWLEFFNKYNFGLKFNFENAYKNEKKLSDGQIALSNYKLCFKLLSDWFDEEFHIFIDEIETYLHPQYINEICKTIIELNKNNPNYRFYISSHSPQVISNFINNVNSGLNIFKGEKGNFKKLKLGGFLTANKVLFEVYKVYSIEFLDELIAKINNLNADDSQKFPIKITTEEHNITPHSDLIPLASTHTSYYCLHNGRTIPWTHKSLVCFVRNYYHHPENREYPINYTKDARGKDESYNEFLSINYPGKTIDSLLEGAIDNCIKILKDVGEYKEAETEK